MEKSRDFSSFFLARIMISSDKKKKKKWHTDRFSSLPDFWTESKIIRIRMKLDLIFFNFSYTDAN